MAGFRLLACDLDGTLLNGDGRFPAVVSELLREVQESGVHVVPATGRRLHSVLPLVQAVGLRGPCVVQNGALVADMESGELLQQCLLPASLVPRVLAFLRRRGCAPLLYTTAPRGPEEIYLERGAPDPTGFLAWYLTHAEGHYTLVADWSAPPVEGVVRCTCHDERARLTQVRDEFQHEIGSPLRCFLTFDPAQQVHRLEIVHEDATKWYGLCFLMQGLGVAAEEVLAVGDDTNDVEMLREAGHSLAPGAATAEARAAADQVLSQSGPEAVATALREILWDAVR